MQSQMLLLQLLVLGTTAVQGCRVTGSIFDIQSSFSNLATPTTLALEYTYTWITTGMPCGTLNVFTDRQTIVAGGSSWYAFPAIISRQPLPVTYTHHFTDLTMTDLQSLGPAIYWLATWTGEFQGSWSQVIYINYPTPPPTGATAPSDIVITDPPALTPTSSSSPKSKSLTPGAIAGIVVGVLVGLLAFVIACFFFIQRKAVRSSQRLSDIEPDRKIVFTPAEGDLPMPRRPESTHSSMYYPEMELNEMGKVLVR